MFSSSSSAGARLKREDCRYTQHDSVFSKWEILIGSSDWEDHSLGKDGVQRYRVHNLLHGSSCPGLYELGLAVIPNDDGRKSRRHNPKNIIVVYLGQTNNVRTRLQQYGRVGAHLDSGKLVSSVNENECSGLFKEVFSRGFSIMFRWAPMINKEKAEKTEAELLDVFDYAWNKCGNGACRRDEILLKLDSEATRKISIILRELERWKDLPFGRKAGINIDESVPLDDQKGCLLPQVLKFGKSQLRLIHGNNSFNEDDKICGVAVGTGSVCKSRPIFGRKRCEVHKGKKIIGTVPVLSRVIESNVDKTSCGVVLEDGSLCAELPAHGRKRCKLHEGRRKTKPELHDMPPMGLSELFDQKETQFQECQPQSVKGAVKHEEEYDICGVILGDGRMCRNRPVCGRKRCVEHKGKKATGTKLKLPTKRECWETEEEYHICGVVFGDGRMCRNRPVDGRKRCVEHKGKKVTGTKLKLPTNRECWETEGDTCGVVSDGNICRKNPVSGNTCGVVSDGKICRKKPVPGRKRCEEHKGQRIRSA